MKRSPTYPVAVALGCALLAGCGSVLGQSPTTQQRPVLATSAHRAPSHKERALLDARSLLRKVQLPAGTKVSASFPGLGPPRPTGNLVDLHHFYVLPLSFRATVSWFTHHPPKGSSSDGTGTSSSGQEWLSFRYPQVPGILNYREIVVGIVAGSHGKAYVRVDTQDSWLPPKPSGDLVPSGATELVASVSRGFNGEKGHRPVVVTTASVVDAIRDLVNALEVEPPGAFHCPADFGQTLSLVFRNGSHGPVLAVVKADVAGCQTVSVTEQGRTAAPVLDGAMAAFVHSVERTLGWLK